MVITPYISFKSLTKDTNFSNHLLIVGAYSKLPIIHVKENINTEEVMDKLDMFQEIFGKVDTFVWQDLEKIQTDDGINFDSEEFQKGLSVR